jgi:lysophospholipase L1-like esterase
MSNPSPGKYPYQGKVILLLLVSIAFSLVGAEVVSRVYLKILDRNLLEHNRQNIITHPPLLKDIFIEHAPEGYVTRPNFLAHWWGHEVHTDSIGCRMGIDSPDSAAIILFIGDSMVFGVGLADSSTVPAILQRALNDIAPSRPCCVINGGVIGYDFQQDYYSLLRLESLLHPKLILVGICINDLYPTEDPFSNILAMRGKSAEKRNLNSGKRYSSNDNFFTRGWKAVSSRSSLYYLIRNAAQLKTQKSEAQQREYTPLKDAATAQAETLIDQFLIYLKKTGKPYAFVNFPGYFTQSGGPPIIYARILQQRGEPLLELGATDILTEGCFFYKQSKSKGHLIPEMHFNEKGSEIIADYLSRWLVDKGLW